jgi:hypothetical protein
MCFITVTHACMRAYRAYEGAVLRIVHVCGERDEFYLAPPQLNSVVLADNFCVCMFVSVCVGKECEE